LLGKGAARGPRYLLKRVVETAALVAAALGSVIFGGWLSRLLAAAAIVFLAPGIWGWLHPSMSGVDWTAAIAVQASAIAVVPLMLLASGVTLWAGINDLLEAARVSQESSARSQ
jgi:hypothetical protein